MGTKRRRRTPDELVGRWAARHHGLITIAKARRFGLSDRQVQMRVKAGRLVRVGRGVYRVNGAPITAEQAAYAAVLSAGSGAVVGGLSAMALFGLSEPPEVPRLTVPSKASARTSGAVILRSPVGSQDQTHVGPIPCVTASRALVEVARHVTGERLDELLDGAIHRKLASSSNILGALRRAPTGWGRAGAAALRASLLPWLGPIQPESPAEARLVRRLEEWGFPAPALQHPVDVGGRHLRLDVAWPERMVAVEYDGKAFHTPRTLEHDEEREAALRAAGWWLVRADGRDLAPSSTRLFELLLPRLGRGLAA